MEEFAGTIQDFHVVQEFPIVHEFHDSRKYRGSREFRGAPRVVAFLLPIEEGSVVFFNVVSFGFDEQLDGSSGKQKSPFALRKQCPLPHLSRSERRLSKTA